MARRHPSRRPLRRDRVVLNTAPRDGYGQSFGYDNCTTWKVNLSNESDTGASDFVFDVPAGGHWTNGDFESLKEWPAPPEPGLVDIYLAPGQGGISPFRCAQTHHDRRARRNTRPGAG